MSITKSLAKRISNYGSQKSFGSRLRTKRIAPLLGFIKTVSKEHGYVSILDIGGTEAYWGIVPQHYLEKYNVKITIVNLPGSEMPTNHGQFTFIYANGCNLAEIQNNAFHIAHSNSVIEHVGDWERMVQFSNEISRVAQKYFVQTPNFWFPIEPHCMTPIFHWLPKPARIWLVMKFSLGNWRKASSVDDAMRIIESARLLNKAMFRELFSDSKVLTERLALLPKSFVAIRE